MVHVLQPAATVLCLLRAGCPGGVTWSSFADDAGPALVHRMSRADLRAAHDAAITELVAGGFVLPKPRARTAVVLSRSGQERAAALLGLTEWPEGISWKGEITPRLSLLALGRLSSKSPRAIRIADDLRRLVLEVRLGILVTSKRVGKAAGLKASRATGAARNHIDSLRKALLQRAAEVLAKGEADWPEVIDAASTAAQRHWKPAVLPGIEDFATIVEQLARETPTGRVGPRLVFINHVWRHVCEVHPEWNLSLAAFKERLKEAGIKGLIDLMVANVMEEQLLPDLRESRIDAGGRRWDLVRLVA